MIIPELLLIITAGSLIIFLRQRGELNRLWGYRLLALATTSILTLLSAFLFPPAVHIALQLIGTFLILWICWQYWEPVAQIWWLIPASLWLVFLFFAPHTAVSLLYGAMLSLLAMTLSHQIEYSNTLLRSTRSTNNTPPFLNNVFVNLPMGVIVTDGYLRIKIDQPSGRPFTRRH